MAEDSDVGHGEVQEITSRSAPAAVGASTLNCPGGGTCQLWGHVVMQPPREVLPVREHLGQWAGACGGGVGRDRRPREKEALQMEVEMVTCWRQLASGDFSQRGLCLRAVELKSSELRKY